MVIAKGSPLLVATTSVAPTLHNTTLLQAGFLPQRPYFAPRAVHMGLVLEKVAPDRKFSKVLRFSPVSTIPPLLYYSLTNHLGVGQRAL